MGGEIYHWLKSFLTPYGFILELLMHFYSMKCKTTVHIRLFFKHLRGSRVTLAVLEQMPLIFALTNILFCWFFVATSVFISGLLYLTEQCDSSNTTMSQYPKLCFCSLAICFFSLYTVFHLWPNYLQWRISLRCYADDTLLYVPTCTCWWLQSNYEVKGLFVSYISSSWILIKLGCWSLLPARHRHQFVEL